MSQEEEKENAENGEEQEVENGEEEEKKQEQLYYDSDDNQITLEEYEARQPKPPQNPLKPQDLLKSVKKLQRTYDGLSYAYTDLDLKEKELDGLCEELNNFTQILDFNVSNNKIPSIDCVAKMPYLIRIDASINELNDMDVFNNPDRFKYLQVLNLKQNKIHSLPEMQADNLLSLDLSENKIKDCSKFKGLIKLKKLNLSNNRISSLEGIANCPELDVLYLNTNRISDLKGLENFPNLRKLRLRQNKLEKFDFVPNLPNLQKLAISENQIKDNVQFSLLKFPLLQRINVDGNPYFDESGANPKIEILIQLEGFEIKFVNKEEITAEDKEEVVKEKEVRKEKAEEERKQREEEERIKKEEEEKERLEKEEEERKRKEEEEAQKANEENKEGEENEEEKENKEGNEENEGEEGNEEEEGKED